MKSFYIDNRYSCLLIRKGVAAIERLNLPSHFCYGIGRTMLLILLLYNSIFIGWGQTTYNLVTSESGLMSGANYLLVNTTTNGTGYALGYQNTSNRPKATITVSSNSISTTAATTNLCSFDTQCHIVCVRF